MKTVRDMVSIKRTETECGGAGGCNVSSVDIRAKAESISNKLLRETETLYSVEINIIISCKRFVIKLAFWGMSTKSGLITNKGLLRLTYYLSPQGNFMVPPYGINSFVASD